MATRKSSYNLKPNVHLEASVVEADTEDYSREFEVGSILQNAQPEAPALEINIEPVPASLAKPEAPEAPAYPKGDIRRQLSAEKDIAPDLIKGLKLENELRAARAKWNSLGYSERPEVIVEQREREVCKAGVTDAELKALNAFKVSVSQIGPAERAAIAANLSRDTEALNALAQSILDRVEAHLAAYFSAGIELVERFAEANGIAPFTCEVTTRVERLQALARNVRETLDPNRPSNPRGWHQPFLHCPMQTLGQLILLKS